MPAYIPAAPETMLLCYHNARPQMPVVGWMVEEGRAFPICPGPCKGIMPGDAVQFQDGSVFDLTLFHGFKDYIMWEDYVDQNPYPVTTEAPNPAKTGGSTAKKESFPANWLSWGDKKFVSNSFWHVVPRDGRPPFVFTLPGGEIAPHDQQATKVKREDYFELRRTIAEKLIGPAEDEAPQPAAPVEESDDSDDMI